MAFRKLETIFAKTLVQQDAAVVFMWNLASNVELYTVIRWRFRAIAEEKRKANASLESAHRVHFALSLTVLKAFLTNIFKLESDVIERLPFRTLLARGWNHEDKEIGKK